MDIMSTTLLANKVSKISNFQTQSLNTSAIWQWQTTSCMSGTWKNLGASTMKAHTHLPTWIYTLTLKKKPFRTAIILTTGFTLSFKFLMTLPIMISSVARWPYTTFTKSLHNFITEFRILTLLKLLKLLNIYHSFKWHKNSKEPSLKILPS